MCTTNVLLYCTTMNTISTKYYYSLDRIEDFAVRSWRNTDHGHWAQHYLLMCLEIEGLWANIQTSNVGILKMKTHLILTPCLKLGINH